MSGRLGGSVEVELCLSQLGLHFTQALKRGVRSNACEVVWVLLCGLCG